MWCHGLVGETNGGEFEGLYDQLVYGGAAYVAILWWMTWDGYPDGSGPLTAFDSIVLFVVGPGKLVLTGFVVFELARRLVRFCLRLRRRWRRQAVLDAIVN